MQITNRQIAATLVAGLLTSAWCISADTLEVSATTTVKNPQEMAITLTYKLSPQGTKPSDAIRADTLRFSTLDPTITLTPFTASSKPVSVYDASSKTDILVYQNAGTFTLTATRPTGSSPNTTLFMHYQRLQDALPAEKTFALEFAETTQSPAPARPACPPELAGARENLCDGKCEGRVEGHERAIEQISATTSTSPTPGLTVAPPSTVPEPNIPLPDTNTPTVMGGVRSTIGSATAFFTKTFESIKKYVSDVVTHTQSPFMRLILIFLLGLLMSLTPCIYPMIPITIGVLQASAHTSLRRNFMLALCYVVGIATTFSILGLLAASGSAQFGALLGKPWFVIALVCFLAYFAFSMFGFYEVKIPKFFQSLQPDMPTSGSYLSTFAFGALSGTVASPCLSPGLILLLSLVATIGSKLVGFLYLFTFGLGLGFPLLIIGTFSNSISVMPRAGNWMLEIKKVFGVLLLALCFYYVSNILAWHLVLWGIAATLGLLGIMVHMSVKSYDGKGLKTYKRLVGIFLIIGAVITAYSAFKASFESTESAQHKTISYQDAKKEALAEHTLLLIEFGASWCPSCRAIAKQLVQPEFQKALAGHAIFVATDCTNATEEPAASLQKQFGVQGVPAVLLIDPQTETVKQRWDSSILAQTPEQLVQAIKPHKTA